MNVWGTLPSQGDRVGSGNTRTDPAGGAQAAVEPRFPGSKVVRALGKVSGVLVGARSDAGQRRSNPSRFPGGDERRGAGPDRCSARSVGPLAKRWTDDAEDRHESGSSPTGRWSLLNRAGGYVSRSALSCSTADCST